LGHYTDNGTAATEHTGEVRQWRTYADASGDGWRKWLGPIEWAVQLAEQS
jgi:hypothetical protein